MLLVRCIALATSRLGAHNRTRPGRRACRSPARLRRRISVRGINHHVITRDSYLRNRGALEPSSPHTPLVARGHRIRVRWRPRHLARFGRYGSGGGARGTDECTHGSSSRTMSLGSESEPVWWCRHDALPWNSDPALNPALQQSKADSWYNSFGSMVYGNPFSELLMKRDDNRLHWHEYQVSAHVVS